MRPCVACGHHILMSHRSCPHCTDVKSEKPQSSHVAKSSTIALGFLLGLGAVGCGETDKDTATEDSAVEEPASEPDMAAEYGVPAVESNP